MVVCTLMAEACFRNQQSCFLDGGFGRQPPITQTGPCDVTRTQREGAWHVAPASSVVLDTLLSCLKFALKSALLLLVKCIFLPKLNLYFAFMATSTLSMPCLQKWIPHC